MEYLFIEYPKCSTCKNAKKWLEENHICFKERHIVEETPTKEELRKWIEQSGLDMKKFFNTSGMLYKELNLKEKLLSMNEEEKLDILASNGMLIKRPLLIGTDKILIGFKKVEWESQLL